MNRRRASLAIVVLAALVARATAAPSCAADCARHMAECRETRCAGVSRKACRDTCRALTGCASGGAKVRTLATVVTECRTGPEGSTAASRLEIRRGDCAPVTVLNVESAGSIPDDHGLCALYGQSRYGPASELVGAFQRVGVSPDGRTVVFDVNHGDAVFEVWPFVPPKDGIYRVRADGSAIRWLGPASRYPPFKVFPADNQAGFGVQGWEDLSFSPDGRLVVFSDRGPGADGSDAVQVVVMNIDSGARTQLTHFVAASQGNPTIQDAAGLFIDNDTLYVFENPNGYGSSGSSSTVKKDGTDLRPLPPLDLVPIKGAQVVPMFQVVSRHRLAFPVGLPTTTTEPSPGSVFEIFAQAGGILARGAENELLQLTNFGRSDTRSAVLNRNGHDAFFLASADPLAKNPSQICQLFSIGFLGDDLRQITRFGLPRTPSFATGSGCLGAQCQIALAIEPAFDPAADVLTFDASCNPPSGTNPSGAQFFAVRGDGSGLRQLTNYRGMQVAPDGTVTVELPGPSAAARRS
jgi:hypothetical protein